MDPCENKRLSYLELIKQKNHIKNILPRSGSYDVNCHTNEDPLQPSGTCNLKKEKITFKSFSSMTKLFNDSNGVNDRDLLTKCMENNESFANAYNTVTCLGIQLKHLSYMAAVYTFLAYGTISLISIFYLTTHESSILIPLYILLAGYLVICFISFLLIIAIKKDILNIITFWIIIISVFILPEIGLNILLVETSMEWLNTSESFHKTTLIMLICRIVLEIPCIVIILIYHIKKTKRSNYLHDMLQPIKNNIINGEALRIYNNLNIDSFDQLSQTPPNGDLSTNQEIYIDSHHETNASNKPQPNPFGNTYVYKFSQNANHSVYLKPANTSLKFIRFDAEKSNPQTNSFTSKDYDQNALHLVWGVDNNNNITQPAKKEIESETEQVTLTPQALVRNHRHEKSNLNRVFSLSSPTLNRILESATVEHHHQLDSFKNQIKLVPGTTTNPLFEASIDESDPRLMNVLTRSNSLDQNKLSQSSSRYEGPIIKLLIKDNQLVSFNKSPVAACLEQSTNFKCSKSLNLGNHHIYLPPAPTICLNEHLGNSPSLIEASIIEADVPNIFPSTKDL